MDKSIRLPGLTLGTCYYPEHWDRSLWEDDLARMADHGIGMVRVAEFAWSKFEPTEGQFTAGFFMEFLDLAQKHGIRVILGTPSATPPAWLTQKYPEVLNADINGHLMRHGMRRHYNYNSPVYRSLVARLVEFMARSYCGHPAVAGWQIDNELNCECDRFFSDSDHAAFRAYLKEKYATLDALNAAMGTVFWDQTFTDWEQVYLTRNSVHPGMGNPHLQLEERAFISRSAIAFCALQADILRRFAPQGQFITTNGLFDNLDNHEMTDRALDFICYDSYPNFAFQDGTAPGKPGALDDRGSGWGLSRTRAISPNFAVMELQSGAGGWVGSMRSPMPKPGQMRLWTWQSIAHGADYISYFRWRTCTVGTEIYWHGLNDYDNRPNRRLAELKVIQGEVAALAGIAGTRYEAPAALVMDYPNLWDSDIDLWHRTLSQQSEPAWVAAAQHVHLPLDALYLRQGTAPEELSRYRLLVYPHPLILTQEAVGLLEDFVRGGGTLILGARTGQKDEYGRCRMLPVPGPAVELCAARVSDYTALGPGDAPNPVLWDGELLDAPVFHDVLEALPGGRVLGTFTGGYYAGQPALVAHSLGRGTVYCYGSAFTQQTAEGMLRRLGLSEPYGDAISLPDTMELAVRGDGGKRYYFILNYKANPGQVRLARPMTELLTGLTLSGTADVPAYGVLVLADGTAQEG